MPDGPEVAPPDLPAASQLTPAAVGSGSVELAAALVDGTGAGPFEVSRLRATDSELRSVTLAPAERLAMTLRDTVLRDCDISNQRAEGCSLRRVEFHATRALGLNVSEVDARDVRITASSMSLASFAHGRIESCIFDSVDLREAVFMHTTLVRVAFLDCDLTGADFRGARLDACRLRRTRLTGILGAESLRGLSMPWADVLDAAGVFAAALGVEIEPE